jgi:Ni,Fe-hydrogenase III large subunit/Ni,Fe-hydrogenase III component G
VNSGTEDASAEIYAMLSDFGALLNTPGEQLVQVQVRSDARLRELAERLSRESYYLVTVVANDERELEDRRYKIYYVFSHLSADLFVIIEYLLDHGSVHYCSISDLVPAAEPFEREIRDLVGLCPATNEHVAAAGKVTRGSWLHDAYPPDLFPLRRTDTAAELRERVVADAKDRRLDDLSAYRPAGPPDGIFAGTSFPVGPIHAGIIESGQFWITATGETIEDLQLRLGYNHRGIERMFQSYLNLIDGWRLAEQVSGDTSFAHSLAYCRAAEVLTDTEVPAAARFLRPVFLELERIHNHVAALGGLAEDVGMEQFAAEFAVLREGVLRLNKRLAGHRYLRSVNRVGGIGVAEPIEAACVTGELGRWIGSFEGLARALIVRSGFRDRTIRVGVLTRREGLKLGVTGLVARASGITRDSRLGHPVGAYRDAEEILLAPGVVIGDDKEAGAGDVFARTLVRVREVFVSHRLIEWLIGQWSELEPADRLKLATEPRILPKNNYTSAIGHAEGCRGDVVYWLMQDKMNGIYRCKVRDPSMLNWPALRVCASPRTRDGNRLETLVADFPLLNKSFSLSYAGNDL